MGRCRLVFSGAGGQGVITASILYAEAAAVYEGLNAVQSQSYGPEARGGATRSDVVLSSEPIRYPKVIQPNVLVTLTQEAYNRYAPSIRPGGLILTDSRFVTVERKMDARQIELPMYDRVVKETGRPLGFNICMLGVVILLVGLVRRESVEKVLRRRTPLDLLEANRRALQWGTELAPPGVQWEGGDL